jgi:tRNA pseudouridine13 synthase
MSASAPAHSTCLTADLPPLAGRIKERPEDFLVDEQPLYQPGGEGEHIYLLVEKRELSTAAAAGILARHFGVPLGAVGFAGLKDKIAITRQVFSLHVPGKKPEDFPMLQHERLKVLWADRHTNKLRRGHLAGNRFSIRIRGVPPTGVLVAQRVLTVLEQRGTPNFLGEQRFGATGRNHLVGRALLLGDARGVLDAILGPAEGLGAAQAAARQLYAQGDPAGALHQFPRDWRTERRLLALLARGASPEKAIRSLERDEEVFYLTAFQSAIFNDVLARRLRQGMFDQLLEGDLAFKHDSGAVFEITGDNLDDELRARLARREISPSGPMWGARMKRAGGEVDHMEVEALASTGVQIDHLLAYDHRRAGRISGERRPLRIPITDTDVEGGVDEHGSYVRIAFDLPRGAFATAVLREIIKSPRLAGAPDDDGGGGD